MYPYVLAILNHTGQDLVLPIDIFSVISHVPKRPTEEQMDFFTACIVTTNCKRFRWGCDYFGEKKPFQAPAIIYVRD
jgi:hypothetical protein